jgi:hypothetical protein
MNLRVSLGLSGEAGPEAGIASVRKTPVFRTLRFEGGITLKVEDIPVRKTMSDWVITSEAIRQGFPTPFKFPYATNWGVSLLRAYQGPEFRNAIAKIMSQIDVEIVKRSDHAKGFVVLPKRWVVERTLAWLNRCRRLAKDWENLNRKARAFLLLASIRLMVRRLCNPR